MRSCYTACCLVLALCLGVSGCAGSASGRSADAAAPARPGESSAPRPAARRSALALLPADANFVVGFHLPQLRASRLFQELEPLLLDTFQDELAQLRQVCQLDPLELMHSVVIGGRANGNGFTLVVQGITRDQLTRCDQALARANGTAPAIRHQGQLSRVDEGGRTFWLGWPDEGTILARADGDRAWVEQRLADQHGLARNQAMMALLGNVLTEASAWLVLQPDSAPAAGTPVALQGLYVTISLLNGLELDGALRMASPADAERLVQLVDQQRASVQSSALGAYVAKLSLGAVDSEVVIQLRLSDAELVELIQVMREDPLMQMFWPMLARP